MAALACQCASSSVLASEVSRSSYSGGQDGFAQFAGLRASPQGAPARIVIPAQRAHRRSPMARAATVVVPKFTTMKPLADRVLVKMVTAEEKTSGGILLPSAAQTKPQGGEVVAVGEGRSIGDKKLPIGVEVGAKIVYSKYAGTEVEFNGTEHLLLKEDDILGLLSTDDVKDLNPLNDRVLLKVLEAESKTAGGVLLTESAKEKPVIGEVVATGPGGLGEDGSRKPLELKAGSTVLYSKYAGSEFKSKDDTLYVIMRASDVMAVLS